MSASTASPKVPYHQFTESAYKDLRKQLVSTERNLSRAALRNEHITRVLHNMMTQSIATDDQSSPCFEWDCDVEDGGIVLSTQTICSNQPVTLDVYGFEAQYFKWLKSSDNDTWVGIASSDTNLYTTDTLIDTMFYRTAASCDNIAWDSSASMCTKLLTMLCLQSRPLLSSQKNTHRC